MRIIGIDYGKKRTGLAVTDPLKIIASGLCTVETPKVIEFLKKYLFAEDIELFVIGMPKNLDGRDTDATALVKQFIEVLNKQFPAIPVKEIDERLTSKMAQRSMIESGLKKKHRRDKGLVDEISATIILQHYLQAL